MIKTLRLKNFKAFKDTGDIELKPITVLAGPNSAGKSSILQSLLLLKQTLISDLRVALNLDGEYLQASSISDLTFGKPLPNRCKISYKMCMITNIPDWAVDKYFSIIDASKSKTNPELHSKIQFSYRYGKAKEGKKSVILDKFEITQTINRYIGPRLNVKYLEGKQMVNIKGKGTKFSIPRDQIEGITLINSHFIPSILLLETGEDKEMPVIEPLPDIFHVPLEVLKKELTKNLEFLGPLRHPPQRAYLHSGSPSPEIGQSGEYAPQILWLERKKKIRYFPGLDGEPEEMTLLEAVNESFKYMGMNQPIDVKSEESVMYQILLGIKTKRRKKNVTIADVGFGVSQLLPIVLLGLRSTDESLLLFEQPEIHLHPNLQANLADFFLTLIRSGKRILVETHSDHFINRLRRRIAEDKTNTLKDKVNILFIHPPENGKGAAIKPLKVDPYGIIENWPPDFLPESANEAEAIFKAGLKKRRGKKEC